MNEKILEEMQGKTPINLIEQLLVVPAYIQEKEIKLQEVRLKLEDLNYKINRWELEEMRIIMEELTADGKKLYPNETIREAEITRRKDNNKEIQAIKEEIKTIQYQVNSLIIELTYLDKKFKALRSIADIFSRR